MKKIQNFVVLAMIAFIAMPSMVSAITRTNRLTNICRLQKRVAFRPFLTILSLLIVLLMIVQGAVALTCIDDVTGVNNVCTANDVGLGTFYRVGGPTDCLSGETIQVQLQAEMISTAADRYDIGLFIAEDGGNARTGTCYKDYLPPPLADLSTYDPGAAYPASGGGPFYDAESDFCGDLTQGVSTFRDVGEVTNSPQPGSGPVWITVECQDLVDANGDPNHDGTADVSTCVSWDNQAGTVCTSIDDTVPNTKAKCNCESIPIAGITVFQPAHLVIVKQTNPDGSAQTFEFSTDYGPNFVLTDGQSNDSGPLMPDTYSVSEIPVVSWELTTATCDDGSTPNAIDLQSGETVTCTFTNTFVGVPSMTIEKSSATTSVTTAGQVVPYSYLVTNNGTVTLNNIVVTDSMADASPSCPVSTLAPADSTTCSASHTVTQAEMDAGGDLSNTGIADSDETEPVNDILNILITQDPSMTIVKTATPGTYDTVGQIISYSYNVTNAGNVLISGPITIDDDKATDESCPTGDLAPGASTTCTASYTITQDDLNSGSVTNVASAAGTDTNGDPVTSPTDTETVDAIQNPAIDVIKTSDATGTNSVDDVITYTYNVTNIGDVTLTGVTVVDN
ncbi:MAG: hypothetical protein E4G94_07990, partial [ANME-2 cluster archaeon]